MSPPTKIVVSKERLLFRIGLRPITIFAGGPLPEFPDNPHATALIQGWIDWLAGRINDLQMLEPLP